MTDANKTSTSHGRGLSIYAKCLSIAALATIVVTLALSINSYRMNVQLVKEGVTELGMAINRETASALGGAVRFNNVAEVNSRLEVMFINDIGYLSQAVVVNTAGEILADQSSDASVLAPAQMAAATAVAQGTSDSTSFGDMGAVHPITVGADNTVVGAVATQWHADQRISVVTTNMLNGLLAALVLFIALLVASGWMLKRLVGTPLRLLENDVDAVAKGDYGREISGTARMDEIGNLSRSLSEMTNGLAEARRVVDEKLEGQAAEQMVMSALRDGLQTLAAGNLTARIDQEFPNNFNQLRDDFNATAAKLGQTIAAVVSCTTNIDRGSQDIGRQSEELSQRTENQAATLEETAAAIDQLTNLVKKVADDARTVEDSVKQTQSQAQESGQVVREAVQAMSAIEESSGKISTIISVIDDIAFQTNLLALNAGVEAARAGEAGRGFAVVASEVRALAQRSSDAAREIKGLIDNSSEQVGRGVDLVGRTGEALTGISERVTETTELIIQMASGAAEQSVSLGEINISVNDLDQNTQKNASMVDLANTTARSLRQQSTDLGQIVSGFQLSAQRAQSIAA